MPKRAKVGDVIRIPLSDGQIALGKILFISKRYKNVMLVGVYPFRHSPMELPSTWPKEFAGMMYTSTRGVSSGEWDVVNHQTVTVEEHQLSTCIIAGEVWVGDEHIRSATTQDLGNLPEMEQLGIHLFVKKVSALV